MNRTRLVFFGALALTVALLVWSLAGIRTADGYTPPQSGTTLPQFATPALLAAAPVAQLTNGAEAWVTYQGIWAFQPVCPSSCDGANTCRTAGGVDGGVGCWVRQTSGVPSACAQATWTVTPSTGSDAAAGTAIAPLATAQEITRRMTGCVVSTQVVITITGDLAATDWITPPTIGPAGYVTYAGASGATTLFTSTDAGITAAAATVPASNAQAYFYDSHAGNFLDAGPEGGPLVGYRFRVTGGTRAGTIAWITSVDGGQAWISDPELDTFILDAGQKPAPGYTGLVTQTLTAGDPYVIERLPLVNAPQFQNTVSAEALDPAGADSTKLIFDSLGFSEGIRFPDFSQVVLSLTMVPAYGNSDNVVFIGSYPGFIGGTFAAYASLWDNGGFAPLMGSSPFLFGCAILGDMAASGDVSFEQRTVLVENCQVCPNASGTSSITLGKNYAQGFGIFGGTLQIQPSSTLTASVANAIYGTGTGGVCIHVGSAGSYVNSSVTYTCADAGATTVATTTQSWAQIIDAGGLSARSAFAGPPN